MAEPILETERLSFRRLVLEDLDELFALYGDPEIRRHFPEGTLTRDQTGEELEWFMDGHPEHPELGLWATIHRPSGRFIGRCGLLPWTIEGRFEVEVAYLIAAGFQRPGPGHGGGAGDSRVRLHHARPAAAGVPDRSREPGVDRRRPRHRHDARARLGG